ncbi:aldehyde dehydrogenase [Naegleria gruberi]|uniref:Aldehyde dehydrogenase n=1 Tax=Naegleria gruberi TaxID=5762 RepID=D2VTY9_NAEGR|nr:aldehyde dehydrogenase [Naegleria gruberi]EFC39741.1 aldehyde dehydrogenase [Naegleria gruberi]|eukprot:XP_002672485.1 aldehyde dehydrogenase [Naegleria gruberi strain NEG-M]
MSVFTFGQYAIYTVIGYMVIKFIYKLIFGRSYMWKQVKPFDTKKRLSTPLQEWVATTRKNPQGRQMIPCTNPGTGEELCDPVPAMNTQDVEERISSAKKAFEGWSKTSFEDRKRVLLHLLDNILKHKHEIVAKSCKDTGKTMFEAHLGEVVMTCEKIRWLTTRGEQFLSPETRHVPLMMIYKVATVQYLPLGVIGMIVPWNYPFQNAINAIIAALFAGNSVVIKVSEWATWSSVELYEHLVQDALIKAGFSPDTVQFIVGFGEAGNALAKSKNTSHVFFIGSPEIGKKVMMAATENLTPVTLELGGKDPFIVCEDANVDIAVDVAIRASLYNCGQNCIAAERLYVHEKIHDKFVAKAVELMKSLRQRPTCTKDCALEPEEINDIGAMTMSTSIEKIEKVIQDAVKGGAKLVLGGKRNPNLKGQFLEPTLLTEVKNDMNVVQDEVFGPVVTIVKWKDEEEVIGMANSTCYALGSYVFAGDQKRAERIGNRLVAGLTMVNDYGLSYLIQDLPFGGVKVSGFGRFNGPEGLRAFTIQKSFVTNRFPIDMPPPKLIRYPTEGYAHMVVAHLVDFLYGPWTGTVGSLFRLVGALMGKK